MKDHLVDKIHALTDDIMNALREKLTTFTDSNRTKELLDIIRTKKDWGKNELCMAQYGSARENGYYRNRQRLEHGIEEVLLDMEHHQSHRTDKAMRKFDVAKQLITLQLWEQSSHELKEAEKLAQKTKNYALVRQIHALQLEYADTMKISRRDLSDRMDKNEKLDRTYSKVQLVHGQVSADVDELRLRGRTKDYGDKVLGMIRDFGITTEMFYDPWVSLQLCETYRSAIKSKKDYVKFEGFVIEKYNDLHAHATVPIDWKTDFTFVFYIAHACYRNLKFEDTKSWCEIAEKISTPEQRKKHKQYYKFVALTAAAASFTGNNELAIRILLDELNVSEKHIPELDLLDYHVNLAVYYFQSGNFDEVNTWLMKTNRTKKWQREHKGVEWVFKKELIELLVQYEKNKMDVARDWAVNMQSAYSDFLGHELYKYAAEFLRMIVFMIDRPEEVKSEAFAQRVRALSDSWPVERQDVQAIAFYCWIKSKARCRDYPVVLLEWFERAKQRA